MNNPIWKTKNDIKIPSGFLEHRDNVAITRSINILKDQVKDEVAITIKLWGHGHLLIMFLVLSHF